MSVSPKERKEIEWHLDHGLKECSIPEHMHGAVKRYLLDGIPGGDFLSAVVSNDLREACLKADDVNRWALHNYVRFLFCYAPFGSWGSEKAFKTWVDQHGLNAVR